MIRRVISAMILVAFALVGPALTTNSAHAQGAVYSPPGKYYLALGDSLTYGYQQFKFNAEGTHLDPATFNTGFADDFFRMLKAVDPGIQEVNYGCPGETSASFLTGCTTFPVSALHTPFSGSQLQAAVAFLKAHPDQVSPITINIGNNDILGLVGTCGGPSNLSCIVQGIPGVVQTLSTNLTTILGSLRTAAPHAEILLEGPYNPLAAAYPVTNALAASLQTVYAKIAAATGAIFVDNFTPFNLAQPQPQTLCALTLFCTSLHDVHASDQGYLVMAEDTWTASRYGNLFPGQMVSFVSASPGVGQVYFGSGPGCMGLVEVATMDVQPAGTVHTIYVSGNDLPGTVGNNGIVPGVTYYYETVTATANGIVVDDNGGKCFSFTAGSTLNPMAWPAS